MRKIIIIIIIGGLLLFPFIEINCLGINNDTKNENENSNNSTRSFANSPWPTFQGNERRTGQSIYSTADNPGKLKWRFKTEGVTENSPIIGPGNVIYIGSYNRSLTGNYLYSIYPNGELKWKFTVEWGGATPSIGDDGTIYFDSNGFLQAINPDGTLKWKFNVGTSVGASPLIDQNNNIYVCNSSGYVFALNQNGNLKWKVKTNLTMYTWSSLALGLDGTIYVNTWHWDNQLYAIYPNGTIRWQIITGGWENTPTVGSDGIIYVGSDYNKLYAIYPNGSIKWEYYFSDSIWTSPALANDGSLYIGSKDNYLYALTPNGTLKWKFKTENWIQSSPIISADGTIFFGSHDSYLYGLNPNGKLKWKFKTNDEIISSPAIGADGTVYIGSESGYLYAINRGPPYPPRNLIAFKENDDVKLSWESPKDDNGRPIIEYRIYRNGKFIKSLSPNITEYNDDDINLEFDHGNYIKYSYYITAVNSINESEPSNEESVLFERKYTNNKDNDNGSIPGYELILLLIGIFITLTISKKQKRLNM